MFLICGSFAAKFCPATFGSSALLNMSWQLLEWRKRGKIYLISFKFTLLDCFLRICIQIWIQLVNIFLHKLWISQVHLQPNVWKCWNLWNYDRPNPTLLHWTKSKIIQWRKCTFEEKDLELRLTPINSLQIHIKERLTAQ